MNSPQLLLSWVRSCPFSPNNGFLYFLPSCLSTPLRFTSASSVVLLRLRHSVTSAPSAWPLHIRALVFVIGERTHVSPFVFPRGLGWGRSLAALGCISWVFHCTQPTAFPLTSPWTGPNVYEPWPVVAPPPTTTTPTLHIPAYIWGSTASKHDVYLCFIYDWLRSSIRCHALCWRCRMHNKN